MPRCFLRLLRQSAVALRVGGCLFAATLPWVSVASEFDSIVPATAPRTNILAGRADAFRAYCTTGEGAKAFAKLKADLDAKYLALPFPAEPVTYGDPTPSKRTSDMADQWRAVQDTCGVISAIAETATLCWIVTGEERYLAKAKDFLLRSTTWHFAPDWQSGPVLGATDIYYNDEAHFRLWRKMPLVYDQLRAQLTPAEKASVLAHFKERGNRSVAWIEHEGNISQITRNSIAADLSSHPVRFMPMTGLTALALWDDLPEAREWWAYAYRFYRDQFSPWGGDDGGWGEGSAYWRGTFEHAAFQDALLAIGDPAAYATPFWKNSPLFAIYNVQPYLHTTFGDTSNAGRFNLEPVIADYMEHAARVQQNDFFRAYAELCTDQRTRPIDKGLEDLSRTYPTAAEFLVRNFIASAKPLPPSRPLTELPPHRHFADVGWVSLHSALGRPADDIHVTFKSSPYGSFSHSHADQNSFILNAYGEGLAINSAYREFHNSPHHAQWTRQTISKNALLIDGAGQKAQSKAATGLIRRYLRGRTFRLDDGRRHQGLPDDATEREGEARHARPRLHRQPLCRAPRPRHPHHAGQTFLVAPCRAQPGLGRRRQPRLYPRREGRAHRPVRRTRRRVARHRHRPIPRSRRPEIRHRRGHRRLPHRQVAQSAASHTREQGCGGELHRVDRALAGTQRHRPRSRSRPSGSSARSSSPAPTARPTPSPLPMTRSTFASLACLVLLPVAASALDAWQRTPAELTRSPRKSRRHSRPPSPP